MLKLKALLLTQGMHGMISQVEGLAKALRLSFRHETIQLKKFWNFFSHLSSFTNPEFNIGKFSFLISSNPF